jgi:hypothetical protein
MYVWSLLVGRQPDGLWYAHHLRAGVWLVAREAHCSSRSQRVSLPPCLPPSRRSPPLVAGLPHSARASFCCLVVSTTSRTSSAAGGLVGRCLAQHGRRRGQAQAIRSSWSVRLFRERARTWQSGMAGWCCLDVGCSSRLAFRTCPGAPEPKFGRSVISH